MPALTYRKLSDLPADLPVFPLDAAILLPHWHLALNIFEPRYLNMIDDAMVGNRLIGMVQTRGGPRDHPALAEVGCAGRITAYQETDDGRYLITLTGICRFRVGEEQESRAPYRIIRPVWAPYACDLEPQTLAHLPAREVLLGALRDYVARSQLSADWDELEDVAMDALINALATGCPFSVAEKQALLEARTLPERCDTLIALLNMDTAGHDEGPMQ